MQIKSNLGLHAPNQQKAPGVLRRRTKDELRPSGDLLMRDRNLSYTADRRLLRNKPLPDCGHLGRGSNPPPMIHRLALCLGAAKAANGMFPICRSYRSLDLNPPVPSKSLQGFSNSRTSIALNRLLKKPSRGATPMP